MFSDPATLPVLAVVFLATLVRSAFGFSEALVAVTLLALIMPVQVAVPFATLLSVAIAELILLQDWRKVHVCSVRWLVLPTLVGIPLGLLLLTEVSPPAVKAVMAAVIIAFSSYGLFGPRRPQLQDDRTAWAFGFGAGVLGGAYGMNGPRWSSTPPFEVGPPSTSAPPFRDTSCPPALRAWPGSGLRGYGCPDVTRNFLASLAPAAVAVVIGRAVNRRMRPQSFARYVHPGLIGLGVLLLLQLL